MRKAQMKKRWSVILVSGLLLLIEGSQSAVAQKGDSDPGVPAARQCAGYPLGPLDQLVVHGLNGEQINETLTVAGDGSIRLPLIGRMVVSGMSAEQLQLELNERLKSFIREPNVSVTQGTPQSRRISVIGAVNQPGVRALRGCDTLIDVISQAGGLRQDAGNTIKITRLAAGGAVTEHVFRSGPATDARFEIIDVRISDLLEAHRPEANILIQADDVISVPRGQLVYVVGAVQKAGGFIVSERDTISVLQALSLAGGLATTPAPQRSRILRGSGAANRTEIAVDVKSILNGKHPDVLLQPDDILFIPSSTTQKVALRTIEAVVQTATGLAIWR